MTKIDSLINEVERLKGINIEPNQQEDNKNIKIIEEENKIDNDLSSFN